MAITRYEDEFIELILPKINKKFREKTAKALDRAVNYAKNNVNIDTGKLKNSVRYDITTRNTRYSQATIRIGSDEGVRGDDGSIGIVDYAQYQEALNPVLPGMRAIIKYEMGRRLN